MIDLYDVAFKHHGIPPPVREFKFWPGRKFRFDFSWPDVMLAVEIEGGMYMRGGGCHQQVTRFKSDMEKYNKATEFGWHLLRYPTGKIDYNQIRQTRLNIIARMGTI
jgi:very-short-patch-repair endonuclease